MNVSLTKTELYVLLSFALDDCDQDAVSENLKANGMSDVNLDFLHAKLQKAYLEA